MLRSEISVEWQLVTLTLSVRLERPEGQDTRVDGLDKAIVMTGR